MRGTVLPSAPAPFPTLSQDPGGRGLPPTPVWQEPPSKGRRPPALSCVRTRNPATLSFLQSLDYNRHFAERKYQPAWFLFFYYWHQLGLYVALDVMH